MMCDFDKKLEQEILGLLTGLSKSPEWTKKMGEGIVIKAKMFGAKGILLLQLKDKIFIIARLRPTRIIGVIHTEHIITEKKISLTDIDLLIETIKEKSKEYFKKPFPIRFPKINDHHTRIIIKNIKKYRMMNVPSKTKYSYLLEKRQRAQDSYYRKRYPELLSIK